MKTNNEKAVIGLCWKTKKKCFSNYKDTLKFARRVEKKQHLAEQALRQRGRTESTEDREERIVVVQAM